MSSSLSSSESEMEDDEEQLPSSDLGGVPWKEAVKIHAKLKGKSAGEDEGALEAGYSEDDDEEEEESEEEEEEEPSSEG